MVIEPAAKFKRELDNFQGLAIINIVFAGITMAFGISIGVQNILFVVQAQSMLLPQLALVTLGFLAAAISTRWLVSSAELLDGAVDIKDDYSKKKNNLDDEGLAGLIVKMMAHYRENRHTIKTMMLISRIAGVCFFINGTFNLATAVISIMAGITRFDVLIQVLGAVVTFIIAAASFAIPHFFGKYSNVWDYRLKEAVKAEKELRRQMEEV